MCHLNGIAVVLHLLATATCAVSFFAPFWMIFLQDRTTQGLWGLCPSDKACIWFQEDNFALQSHWPGWYKAVQALFTIGFILQFATCFVVVFHTVCNCCLKTRRLLIIVACIILAAFVLMILAIALYAGLAYEEDLYNTSLHSSVSVLHWGYYVGVAGILGDLVCAVLFFIEGIRTENKLKGYD